jgi:hypothetical protein
VVKAGAETPRYLAAVKRTKGLLKRFFAHENKRFIAAFDSSLAHKASDPEDPDGKIDNLLDSWDAIADPIAHELDNVFRESASTARSELDATDRVELVVLNKAARNFSRKRAAEMVGKKWVNGQLVDNPRAKWAITDTTREVLRETAKQAFERGWTPVELSKRIEDNGIFGEARAEMVARTEMARAQVEGALTTAGEVGVIAKQSELSNDHEGQDECDEAAELGVIAIDDDFGELGSGPPFHPNCSCSIVFFTEADVEAAEFVHAEAK